MFAPFLAENNNPTEIQFIPGSELPHKLRHLHSFPRRSRLIRVHRYRLLLTAERERVCPSYVRLLVGTRDQQRLLPNMFKRLKNITEIKRKEKKSYK